MIIRNLSSPERSLYIAGANILSVLLSNIEGPIDPLELFETVKENNDLSLSYFIFGLDWLYMIGSIELTEFGDIKVCN